ncbi:NUDIX domain-containing protein [Streptomyces sp. NPDC038707]
MFLPRGKAEAGETPEQCACREPLEETGITARSCRHLGS